MMINGCVPFEPEENCEALLFRFGYTSTQLSSNSPWRAVATYSSPSGLNPSQIQSTAVSKGTLIFSLVSGAQTSYGCRSFCPSACLRTRQYLCQTGRFSRTVWIKLWKTCGGMLLANNDPSKVDGYLRTRWAKTFALIEASKLLPSVFLNARCVSWNPSQAVRRASRSGEARISSKLPAVTVNSLPSLVQAFGNFSSLFVSTFMVL